MKLDSDDTRALVEFANEADDPSGTTAWGPKFDAVVGVARRVRAQAEAIKPGALVTYQGKQATFFGMARDEHQNFVAVIQVQHASLLMFVHPSMIGINSWCHGCGCLEEPVDFEEDQDWPRCPGCFRA